MWEVNRANQSFSKPLCFVPWFHTDTCSASEFENASLPYSSHTSSCLNPLCLQDMALFMDNEQLEPLTQTEPNVLVVVDGHLYARQMQAVRHTKAIQNVVLTLKELPNDNSRFLRLGRQVQPRRLESQPRRRAHQIDQQSGNPAVSKGSMTKESTRSSVRDSALDQGQFGSRRSNQVVQTLGNGPLVRLRLPQKLSGVRITNQLFSRT